MDYCKMCGLPIPLGQGICSMCYGDPYYGNDDYYINWLEQQEEERQEREEYERAWEEEYYK